MEEGKLIELLRQKEESSYTYLVERYRNHVLNIILNILQDSADAEDSAQDVFIQVFESIHKFKGDSSLNTWIYRIAIRKALDKLRQRKNRQLLQKWLPWWMPDEKRVTDNFYHPGVVLENKEKAAILYKAISSLPEKQKIAFTLIKVRNMSYQEVSEIMGQGIKAIESLVGRAKKNLQYKLQQYKGNYNE